jgi:dephospho-CoA kinase
MRRIALTGGIATGKSYVRARFEKLGVPTIDSDTLARDVVALGTPGLAEVVGRFGDGVIDPTGALDRKTLAAIVFADEAARLDLEAIVHPRIRATIARWFLSLDASAPLAVADIPLLFETGRQDEFDAVIVVAVDPEMQVRRVMDRDGLSEQEARARIAAQLPLGDKTGRADYVIHTDGSFADTNSQVDQVYRDLIGQV